MGETRWISMERTELARVRVWAGEQDWDLADVLDAFEAMLNWHEAEEELAGRESYDPLLSKPPSEEELDFLAGRRDAERQALYTVIHKLIYDDDTRTARYHSEAP